MSGLPLSIKKSDYSLRFNVLFYEVQMKILKAIILLFPLFFFLKPVQAEPIRYQVELVFFDNSIFDGTFDYDIATQQMSNLQGLLDDTLMGTVVPIRYQLEAKPDPNGGISSYAYTLNSAEIETSPNINNNVYVAINFNAQDPTLGPTDTEQLGYMDCSSDALMFDNKGIGNCMYHLSWHDPVYFPMGGEHLILSETIRVAEGDMTHSDCLFDWAENNFAGLFSPVQGVANSQTFPPYYFRYYSGTNAYLGISSMDNHIYYLPASGEIMDVGHADNWLEQANCQNELLSY